MEAYMSSNFNPSNKAAFAFRSTFADTMSDKLLIQSEMQSGWHSSPSDANDHLSIKNGMGQVTGHYYKDGSIKDFNGSLNWLTKK